MFWFLLAVYEIPVEGDVGVFMEGDSVSYVEVYYSVPSACLTYEKKGGRYRARYFVDFRVKNLDGEGELFHRFPKLSFVNSPEDAKERQLEAVDVLSVSLLCGKHYLLSVEVEDSISGRKGCWEDTLFLPPWKGPSMSSIQISYYLKQEEGRVFPIPYPGRKFGGRRRILCYYLELYNLKGEVELAYFILSESGDTIQRIKERKLLSSGNLVDAGGINIVALKPGTYRLLARAKAGGLVLSQEKEFYVLSPRRATSPEIPDSLMEYAKEIQYVATREELEIYNSLPDTLKLQYIKSFWMKRDPNPATPENEALLELASRIRYADENFKELGKRGRDTDRGRIYIKYGPPDEITEKTHDLLAKPYVIWIYYSGGGREFIFADKTYTGVYELIYSSEPDEPYDPYWTRWVNPEDVRGVIRRKE